MLSELAPMLSVSRRLSVRFEYLSLRVPRVLGMQQQQKYCMQQLEESSPLRSRSEPR